MSDTAPDRPPRIDWDWAGAWSLVFLANLPILLFFGLLVVGSEGGTLGMFGGLAVVYWVGLMPCLFRFRVGRSLVWGGGVLAVSQVFPVLHWFCGSFGLGMWDEIGGQNLLVGGRFDADRPGWQNNANVAGLLIVFFTAHPLLLLAVLVGSAIRWWRNDRPIWFGRRPRPDAEPAP